MTRTIETWRQRALHILRRGHDLGRRMPPGVRAVVGVLLMIGGVFGFLPILGFWMIPLGLAFIAMEIPPLRRWQARMLQRLIRRSEASPDSEPD